MRLLARMLCALVVVLAVPGVAKATVLRRALTVDSPALAPTYQAGVAWEWQWDAANMSAVPDAVLRAAAGVKIAVIDSGADLSAPDLADKAPSTWSVISRTQRVRDTLGHGTFVSSLAAGSTTDGVGIAGFGGDAQLLVIQAIGRNGFITDVDEAAAIVYAVKHGANIINLSIGGQQTSRIERRAITYAARHGVLLVAAAGNEHEQGTAVEYPAALMRNGIGLAVGATKMDGARASFSNTGSYVSLAAPGENVFAAEPAASDLPRAHAPRGPPRLLRLGERNVLRRSRGLRGCRARLGSEPAPHRAAGRMGVGAERVRRILEPRARLGHARRRRGGPGGAGNARRRAARGASGPAADPLLAALVDLLLPERHRLLERVDRLAAGGQRSLAVRGGDRDRDARRADLDAPDTVVDRDRAELVALEQARSEPGHHVLGHLGVGLVLEMRDLAASRLPPHGAGERRDPAGAIVGDLRHHRLQRQRLLGDSEGAAGDRRDQRDLVAVPKVLVGPGVLAVDGVEQPRGLVAQSERRPYVGDRRSVDLAARPAGLLAETGEEAHGDAHIRLPAPGV